MTFNMYYPLFINSMAKKCTTKGQHEKPLEKTVNASLVPRPSRREGLVRIVRACANYSEIYVREQWACTQNVIVPVRRKEVHCSSAVKQRKEIRAALSLLHGPCASQALLLTELPSCSVDVESTEYFRETW